MKQEQKNPGFKRVALPVLAVGALGVLVHVTHALTLDLMVEYKEVAFCSAKVPAKMSGYRIAFISDTHDAPEKRLSEVVKKLNDKSVDLLILGGDFSTNVDAPRPPLAALSQIKTTDGIFGVEGNHDNHETLFAAMEEFAIRPLDNTGVQLKEGFYLAGVADLFNRSANIAAAIEGAAPGDFVLLISHSPDVAMKQDTAGVDLIVSGHTHGGQMNLFGAWSPIFTFTKPFNNAITKYGQRFRSGWALSPAGIPLYVSNGLGEFAPRIFARPQVTLLTLVQGHQPRPPGPPLS